jgi:phosphatidylglycerophosphate synthase
MDALVIAGHAAISVKLCGLSLLERLLRTLQASGFSRALILTDSEELISEAPRILSPHWTNIACTFLARPAGPVTLEQLAAVWPNDGPDLLVLRGDCVFDPRLLRVLCAQDPPAALVDSAVPAKFHPLVLSAPMTKRGRVCGAALLSRDWVSVRHGPLDDAICEALDDGSLASVDAATRPRYSPELHRELRAYWFPSPTPGHKGVSEKVILDAAQKGTLDIPALAHAPIETFIVSKLCKTSVTPNQLTIFCNMVAWGATVLFAAGHLGSAIAVALAVGVLDGLDGKLARVKLETSQAGKLEHLFDVLFENSWWVALAWCLHASGRLPEAFAYLGLLLGAEALNALARTSVVRSCGKSMAELGPFDRLFRLVSGRRNIYVWILALGLVLGNVPAAFKLIAWWEVATAAVHISRAAWALRQREPGR